MREAEAQLAIKELQKTIHVLNLEYQEFLNNRQAFILASAMAGPASPLASNGSGSSSTSSIGGGSLPGASSSEATVVSNGKTAAAAAATSGNTGANQSPQYHQLEEELLKVKLREAEAVSEMKSLNLKLMQLDTEVSSIKCETRRMGMLKLLLTQKKETSGVQPNQETGRGNTQTKPANLSNTRERDGPKVAADRAASSAGGQGRAAQRTQHDAQAARGRGRTRDRRAATTRRLARGAHPRARDDRPVEHRHGHVQQLAGD